MTISRQDLRSLYLRQIANLSYKKLLIRGNCVVNVHTPLNPPAYGGKFNALPPREGGVGGGGE